jgi:hypothetical protein
VAPPVHRSFGNSPSMPHPRGLNTSEWLGLGSLGVQSGGMSKSIDAAVAVTTAFGALERHLATLISLQKQSFCPLSLFNIKEQIDLSQSYKEISSLVNSNKLSISCASLFLQIELITSIIKKSKTLQEMNQIWLDSSEGENLKVYLDDFAIIQSRVLEESLQVSNPLLAEESSQVLIQSLLIDFFIC